MSKHDTPHLRTGDPGTAEAEKADATYRNAPHTFAAETGADGTVTLTVQQNYTGQRQWFRFAADQWRKLTGSPDPGTSLADALALVDAEQGNDVASGQRLADLEARDPRAARELFALRALAEAVRVYLLANPEHAAGLAAGFTAHELDALVTSAVEMWEQADDAVDYLNAGQQAVLSKARTAVYEDWGVTP